MKGCFPFEHFVAFECVFSPLAATGQHARPLTCNWSSVNGIPSANLHQEIACKAGGAEKTTVISEHAPAPKMRRKLTGADKWSKDDGSCAYSVSLPRFRQWSCCLLHARRDQSAKPREEPQWQKHNYQFKKVVDVKSKLRITIVLWPNLLIVTSCPLCG